MSTEIAIIEIPEEKALDVFTTDNGLDPYLKQIAEQARSLIPDTGTKKGRDQIASVAYKVAKSKTAIDAVGKKLVDELKKKPKLVDAERKKMREFLDSLKDEVRKPLTDWENEEQARIDALVQKVEFVRELREGTDQDDATAIEIEKHIKAAEDLVIDESYQEYEAEAHREKAKTIELLTEALAKRKKYEEEQAELARLRAEAAERRIKEEQERIAREAVEREKREAAERQAKAEAERQAKEKAAAEAAERREREIIEAKEKAERERLEAIEQAKLAEQRVKQAAIETEKRLKREAEEKAKAEAAEQAKREANKRHKAKINNAAVAAIEKAGVTKEQAKAIVVAIAKGSIPAISIQY